MLTNNLSSKDFNFDSRLHIGEMIGKGMERACFRNSQNPQSCYKVSHISHSKQTIREINYFRYLRKRNVNPSFMPKFFDAYKSGNYVIIEQELLCNSDKFVYITLSEFISCASDEELKTLNKFLDKLLHEMLQLNVIVSDIRPGNIMLELKQNRQINKVYIFDGYGAPEFIPLPNYFHFLGKLKILRQWKKFQRYFQRELSKRFPN